MVSNLTAKFSPYTLSFLRIVGAFLYMQHGLQKFGLLEGTVREFPELRWFAGVMESFGGPLLMLGVFTRPLAFLLSGEMASAYFITHAPRGFWTILNGGEDAAFYCFLFLYLATAGPGKLSVDSWLEKRIGRRWWM